MIADRGQYTAEQRIRARVIEDTEGHWIWHGQGAESGAPVIFGHDAKRDARKYVYEAHVGPLDPRVRVYGTCGKTRCVNPAHAAIDRPPYSRTRRIPTPEQLVNAATLIESGMTPYAAAMRLGLNPSTTARVKRELIARAASSPAEVQRMAKVYVAGAWNEKDQRAKAAIAKLRELGILITHDWTEDEVQETWSNATTSNSQMPDEERARRASLDRQGVLDADALLVLAPNYRGASGCWTEMGIALGARIPIVVAGQHARRTIFTSLAQVITEGDVEGVHAVVQLARAHAADRTRVRG